MNRVPTIVRRAALPTAVFVVAATVYVIMLGARRLEPTPDNHFVHLAQSWLEGQLHVVGNEPPGTNDWACFDTETKDLCPNGIYKFPESVKDRYRWYVSFPPFPAVLILPVVAVFGLATLDALFWALVAALAPALVFVLLRHLAETGYTARSVLDNLLLTALFAFGTVFFYASVQGTVWYAAHVVANVLIALHLVWAFGARRPILAGTTLALSFMTRPSTAWLAIFFIVEAMRVSRGSGAATDPDALVWVRAVRWLRDVHVAPFARRIALFALPLAAVAVVAMWMNEARFDDPLEFGHRFLQIRWRDRIERWGMFNFHYVSRNLAVMIAAIPWLSAAYPYVKFSEVGFAIWVSTPNVLQTLWPKRTTATMVALWFGAGAVMLVDLMYQSTGYEQFGYRYALDFMIPLVALLALGGRRFGPGFWTLAAFAVAINAFGAATYYRSWEFYHVPFGDMFQPD